MSYATGTTHYNLPQTVGSDKRDWTDTNQAFSDLDTAVYGAAQGAEAATSAIQTINSELDVIAGKQATDEENITTLNGKVSTLESTTSTLGAEVLDVRQDLQDNIESKHEASATSTHAYAIGDTFYYNDILYKATAAIAIGDTIVPTVNCMGITVMSQVSAIKGDLTASDGLGFEFMTDGDGNYGYRGADDSFVPFSSGGGGGTNFDDLSVKEYYSYEDPTPVMSAHIRYNYSSKELTLKAGFPKGNYLLLNVKNIYWVPGTAPSGITLTPIGTVPSGMLYSVNIADDIAADTVWSGTASGANVGFDFLNTVVVTP